MAFSSRAGWAMTIVAVAITAAPALGQWVEQSFNLQSGWNSIFLEVDPAPDSADELFFGLPIDAVWTRAQFGLIAGPPECADPDDPTCAPRPADQWWVWLAATHPGRIVTTLRVIRGGRTYLIHATQSTTLTVTGIPDSARTNWRGGFSHVGFHVTDDAKAAPTFLDYLAPSGAHANAMVFETLPDGTPSPIADLSVAKITSGKGYWVSSDAALSYDGPISIGNASLRGIDYDVALNEHALELENLGDTPANVTLAYTSSFTTPTTAPTVVGDVPMSWFDYGVVNPAENFVWRPFSTLDRVLGPKGALDDGLTVNLSVNRAGLAGASLDDDGVGSHYAGVVTITSDAGYRRRLPVTAQVSEGVVGARVAGGAAARAGLYFGSVTVDQVAWITAGARVWTNDDPAAPALSLNPDGDTAALRPTPAEFSFPIIVHLSDAAAYKMLREVTLLFEPEDTESGTPGRYILATPACDPEFCDGLLAGSVQDGQPFARRMSTANFSFAGDLMLSGDFATALTAATTLAADDPHNPFYHRYHPDHDCDQVGECYEITRSLTFTFDTSPPPNEQIRPGWGDTYLTGNYAESIQGLYKSTVDVAGRFEISRVSTIVTLNGQ